jgi:hypothetical protein
MLAEFMTVIQQSNAQLQENVRADLNAHQESVRTDISKVQAEFKVVRADLNAHQESVRTDIGSVKADISKVQAEFTIVRADLNTHQESVRADINSVRADLKAENEKLIQRFEKQNQEVNKEFEAKLDSEARRLANLVGKVQKETEYELVAVKKQMQVIGTNFEIRLDQSQANTQIVINELTDQIADYRPEVDANVARLGQEFNNKLTSQKESLEELVRRPLRRNPQWTADSSK